MNRSKTLAVVLLLLLATPMLFAQEDPIEDLLQEVITIENPVYKPVLGIGSGVFNFHGDVRNNYLNPSIGDFGYKFNVTTYIDAKRYLKLNLFFLYGKMSANQSSITDPVMNLNFRTDIVDFGVNFEYSFNHFFKNKQTIHPFLSVGVENFQFTPKGDLLSSDGIAYNYWSDGSIRNIPEIAGDVVLSRVIHRDFSYETDLRKREKTLYGLGNYSKNAFAIPVDMGLDFVVSERIYCRLGTSLHFTMTDFLDNVSDKGTHVEGRKGNDFFTYNYLTLHFDLFSEPETQIVEKLFADLEFDNIMLDDEDGDFILDAVDDCPGTPYGVVVDSLGCPLDQDKDGIPDYRDEEPLSMPDVWVDGKGKTLTEEEFLALLMNRDQAMSREDIMKYFETIGKTYSARRIQEIPEKFKQIDLDKDGYISFDELLKAIDSYFDYKLNYTVEDIYELNSVFFNQ
jgi:Ca2+-binding EF-hand superfamily protein